MHGQLETVSNELIMLRPERIGAMPARPPIVHPTIVDPNKGKRRAVTQDDIDGMVHHC